jgi:hypothetical protein
MITRIRNAVTAKHTRVDLPASKLKAEIARILQDEGYIQGFRLHVRRTASEAGLFAFTRRPGRTCVPTWLWNPWTSFPKAIGPRRSSSR